jgi:hypothetical protein
MIESTGRYLCERCFDAMTNTILPASQSETGDEIAVCAGCLSPEEKTAMASKK